MPAATNVSLALTEEGRSALIQDAEQAGLDVSTHATRIIEDYLISCRGLLDAAAQNDILLSRSLIDRAVEKAQELAEADFRPSITYEAIELASADPKWLTDYETVVRDKAHKHGNARKQTINQNLGYFIKKRLGAKSILKPDGKPANVKVKGSIIQSYTPLER